MTNDWETSATVTTRGAAGGHPRAGCGDAAMTSTMEYSSLKTSWTQESLTLIRLIELPRPNPSSTYITMLLDERYVLKKPAQ